MSCQLALQHPDLTHTLVFIFVRLAQYHIEIGWGYNLYYSSNSLLNMSPRFPSFSSHSTVSLERSLTVLTTTHELKSASLPIHLQISIILSPVGIRNNLHHETITPSPIFKCILGIHTPCSIYMIFTV